MKFIKDQKIAVQIIYLMLLSFFIITIVLFVTNELIFRTYEDYFIHREDNVQSFAKDVVMRELGKVENQALSVVLNPITQELCAKLTKPISFAERMDVRFDLKSYVSSIYKEPYIVSISLFDRNGLNIAGEPDSLLMQGNGLEGMLARTREAMGSSVWSTYDRKGRILLSRDIRYMDKEDKTSIGTVVIDVDVRRLFSEIQAASIGKETTLIFAYGGNELYNTTAISYEEISSIQEQLKNTNGNLVNVKQNDYYIFQKSDESTEFDLITILPAHELTDVIKKINVMTLVTIFISFFGIVILSNIMVKMILRPIKVISREMMLMESGCFDIAQYKVPENYKKNEIYHFHNSFYTLIQKVDNHIKETYQLEIERNQLELDMLSAQIEPHFLYNTLDTAYYLILNGNNDSAAQIVYLMSCIFRESLNRRETLTTVGKEMFLVGQYVSILQIRYQERFRFEQDIPESILNELMPSFIIQPLIENSVKHVLDNSVEGCDVRLHIYKEDDVLTITVADNGPQVIANYKNSLLENAEPGIAIKNIMKRIALLNDSESNITFELEGDSLFVVTIRFTKLK